MRIDKDWWKTFGDDYLNRLIEKALNGNLDLKILSKRVAIAGFSLDTQHASLWPKVSGTSSVSAQKQSAQVATTSFSAQTSLNWELDIWGKIALNIKSQQAAFKASESDWRAGYLTLVADVANRYFQIRLIDEQIDRQQHSLNKNQLILDNYFAQHKEGLLSSTQLLSQKAELNGIRQQQIELQRQRKNNENSLATLLGAPAGSLSVPVAHLSHTVQLPEVPAGIPADLLNRRPDLIAAEYRVLQAHALLGQAKLARLPSISLTGNGGFVSNVLSQLLKSWSFGLAPAINLAIFDPGFKIQVKTNQVQTKIEEDVYRKVVMAAFEEVEAALVNLSFHKKQKIELDKQLEHLQVVSKHVQARLKEGMVSQLEVFESERTLLNTEQQLLSIYQQVLLDTVALYKALGGGWYNPQVSSIPISKHWQESHNAT